MRKYTNLTPKLPTKTQESSFKRRQASFDYRTEPKRYNQQSIEYRALPRQKVKTVPSLGLDNISTRVQQYSSYKKNPIINIDKIKRILKLPEIKTSSFQQNIKEKYVIKSGRKVLAPKQTYYVAKMYKSLKIYESSYTMGLFRQHFYHYIQIFRFGKNIKIKYPKKIIKLTRNNTSFKTILLDLDQTLIHCDQNPAKKHTVTLNFPLEDGTLLAAGVNIRPFCRQFLRQLSKFAQIIIFTASSSSYADVILDYLDPHKKMISHRLYREHCTQEKGYYLKDLRSVNRNLQNMLLVDNSPYCHLLQPENAVPIIPFYHYAKDNELQQLLQFLRQIVKKNDMREEIQKIFYWSLFLNTYGNLPALFIQHYEKQ